MKVAIRRPRVRRVFAVGSRGAEAFSEKTTTCRFLQAVFWAFKPALAESIAYLAHTIDYGGPLTLGTWNATTPGRQRMRPSHRLRDRSEIPKIAARLYDSESIATCHARERKMLAKLPL